MARSVAVPPGDAPKEHDLDYDTHAYGDDEKNPGRKRHALLCDSRAGAADSSQGPASYYHRLITTFLSV